MTAIFGDYLFRTMKLWDLDLPHQNKWPSSISSSAYQSPREMMLPFLPESVSRIQCDSGPKLRMGETFKYQVCVSHSLVSDSLWSHRLKPVRLLCLWNSPGKNIGVGCHSLLQRILFWGSQSLSHSLELSLSLWLKEGTVSHNVLPATLTCELCGRLKLSMV